MGEALERTIGARSVFGAAAVCAVARYPLDDPAIGFVADLKQVAPDKPFFLYYATGANHAPHQAPREWADKYKGKFDDGWDAYREKVFARQKELGIVAADAELSRHDPDVQQWDELPADERKLYARMMEVYAGFMAQTDHEVGRIVTALKDMGEWDDTLFVYIIGDNGAAAAGGIDGVFNEIVAPSTASWASSSTMTVGGWARAAQPDCWSTEQRSVRPYRGHGSARLQRRRGHRCRPGHRHTGGRQL